MRWFRRQAFLLGGLLSLAGCGMSAAEDGIGFLQIRDGYFWDPVSESSFLPRGVAYQTWNPPVFANQSFDQVAYDMRQFAKLRFNSVRAEFVWGEIEVEEDVYDWSRSDFLVRTAEELGLKLFVLIGYQYPPSWFPEEHRAINDRNTVSDVLNYQSPVAQAAYAEHIEAVVTRYKDSPAIGAWILGNEFAYFDVWELQDLYPARRLLGYDPLSLVDFQNWLEGTYGGDIASLNANWSSVYTDFDKVVMPPVYPANRIDPGYHDLINWRKQTIARIIAMGAKAAKDHDPNHLISYSMVGGILTGVDANNTCEDPEVIVRHCADAGAPIDFWSVNNYAWATEGSELRTADFGIAKYQHRIELPIMLSETGHTSTENFNQDASGRQAEVLPTTLWEALSSGIMGMHFFHWSDRNNFTEDYFIRERGFGIVEQNRTSKGAVFDNIEAMFLRLEEIDVGNLLAGSTDPDPDIVLYLSPESDMEFPRANQEQTMLSGILRRLGYQVGLIGPEDVLAGNFGTAKALDLPRCKRLEARVLDHILTSVIPSGIHVHANADLPGEMNAYSQPNPNWAKRLDSLFGVDVGNATVAWAGGVSQEPGETYKLINLRGAGGFGSLPPEFNESLLTWKIWHGVQVTDGSQVLTHSGLDGSVPGSPALIFKDHGTAKAAIQTYAIADTHAATSESGSHPWDIRSDVVGAVYRDYFGVVPKIQLTGSRSQYVVPDYRICRNGSILVSLLNESVEPASLRLSAPELLSGRTVEQLSSGGILETDSDGEVTLEIGGDSFILLYAYDEDGAGGSLISGGPYRVWFESAPQALWAGGPDYSASVGFDARGEELELEVTFESTIEPETVYASSAPTAISGSGTALRSFQVPDANPNAPAYRSTPDGGGYQLFARLKKDGVAVAESAVTVHLLWGVQPVDLPEAVEAGNSYSIEIEWEELPGYLPGEVPNSISRADLFESDAALNQHYNIVLELRDASDAVVASDLVVTREASGSHLLSIDVPGAASGPFYWYGYAQTAADASSDFVESWEGRVTGAAVPFNPVSVDIGPTASGQTNYGAELEQVPIGPESLMVSATIDGSVRMLRDNGEGILLGDGGDSGTIDYETGDISVIFGAVPVVAGSSITVDYQLGRPYPDVIIPWETYTYPELEDGATLYQNHGIHLQGSHGSQSAFFVVQSPAEAGEFSGFGIRYGFAPPRAIPEDIVGRSQHSFSYDYREEMGLGSMLELQLKDVHGAVLLYSQPYEADPANDWMTIGATLDQFEVAPWSLVKEFDSSQVVEILANVQVLQNEIQYVASIDNLRFDGPERMVGGGEIRAVYDSRNDVLADSDGDGIVDIYETGTGVFVGATDTGTDPARADSDGDGQGDGAELIAGSDPTSSQDVFRITGFRTEGSDVVVISWPGVAGRVYEVEVDGPVDGSGRLTFSALVGVDPVEVLTDGPAEARVTMPAGSGRRLYRVAVRNQSP